MALLSEREAQLALVATWMRDTDALITPQEARQMTNKALMHKITHAVTAASEEGKMSVIMQFADARCSKAAAILAKHAGFITTRTGGAKLALSW